MQKPDLLLAEQLFTELRELSFDGIGITRDTYGAGEQAAHQLMRETAMAYGLEVSTDAALNLYITLPGKDRSAPVVMTGSHLDSVPRGGNYDGAAGVVAGMAILAGWAKAGIKPACDVTVMGIRAEESAWFPFSYIGSKAAFGLLNEDVLQYKRFDTQQTLASHLEKLGGLPALVGQGQAKLKAVNIKSFFELHIEQGPVLIEGNTALGIVTGICGSLRYRQAHVTGEYAHSGATPRTHRHDAVVATAELITTLQQAWQQLEADGHELTLTFGQFMTDAQQADFSKVNGDVRFCIDIRSRFVDTLHEMDAIIQQTVKQVEQKHGVTFDLGPTTGSQPAIMDNDLQHRLTIAAGHIGCTSRAMPSGAGHDTSLFSNQGIPTAMVFVRNSHGSHNPDEAMDIEDFNQGVLVMAEVMAQEAGIVMQQQAEVAHA